MKYLLLSALIVGLIAGCAPEQKEVVEQVRRPDRFFPEVLSALYTSEPVEIDGKLDDPVWQKAERYPLYLSADRDSDLPQEGGEIMLAWDEDTLYVGAKLYDSDIYQEGDMDQMHFYQTGDLLEVFLKPEPYEWYWELYGTPNNKKTVFWFPSRQFLGIFRNMDQWTKDLMNLKVAAQVEGTLNKRDDVDEYWTIEMAMPAAHLARWYMTTSPIDKLYFGPGSEWRILIARYNYSNHLEATELSMLPQLSRTNYHMTEEYGIISFEMICADSM